MLLTVSTVKDTLPNLQRFVAHNLAGGVDHLVVFLDAGDREVRAWLDEHPHVTCVRTDASWWAGDRPAELNVRQRVNANTAKAALACLGWAREPGTWLFHVDADEVVHVDREVLAAVPAEERVVRLRALEAVSQERWEAPPTLFKRLLDKPDLTLLQVLGVIDRPQNGAYFHGHVDGKAGIRPGLDTWLTLHQGQDAGGTALEAWGDDRLSVLHFESFSGEDFVRKWTSILEAGPVPSFRPAREPTAVALRALIAKGLSAEQAAPYLLRIYRSTTEDDLTTLRDLGLLVEVDPAAGTHRPAVLPDDGAAALADALERLREAPKRVFHPGTPAERAREVLAGVGLHEPGSGGPLRAARSFLRRS
jgi:hypothetical protein